MASFASVPAKGAPPRPPDKGSFPLDHFGECSAAKTQYMECLKQHQMQGNRDDCRRLSAAYLQCRMDSKLMAQEELDRLGYTQRVLKGDQQRAAQAPATPQPEQAQAPAASEPGAGRAGFIAGLRSKG
eukprot:CAMPEP_0183342758 /NCGR_PEP_ID=MMETSP0164_2-20130417/8815_1 /TAXON_ID=221442 /ORGANISM="Coccolithus pelagicus ssp braarudi, Strain PLY182g" /LENGTH=127 /DNA_ID=CAMNT_0025513447 /DNA_START=14 /DNA_END=397 /DNA_ORIENTATION=-